MTNAITYRHDTHGNMLNLNQIPEDWGLDIRWDWRDMIRGFDCIGGGIARYHYGIDKQRTRKHITRNGGGVVEDRIYLGGYELYRRKKTQSEVVEEIESHHLFEGEQQVLMVDDVIVAKSSAQPGPNRLSIKEQTLFRYQYSNHLGSACLELDHQAEIISYEEYHPYGTSAYRAMRNGIEAPAKRYRFTGMERDEESGLSYHTARYYLPWLGRWGSCDPVFHNNLYYYGDISPLRFIDRFGTQVETPKKHTKSLSDIWRDIQIWWRNTDQQDMANQDKINKVAELQQEAQVEADNANQAAKKEEERIREQEGPSLWDRLSTVVAQGLENIKQKIQNAVEWGAETTLGIKISAANESAEEMVGNIGAEGFEATFGGLHRIQEGKGASTFETPAHLGRETTLMYYKSGRDYAVGKIGSALVGAAIPMKGGKFKMYWNKQELQAAEFMWRSEGKLWRREAEIWLMKDGKLVKTSRRLDALLFDITSGEVEAAEWSTAKNLSEGAAKKAQLQYQKELFEKANEGWTILARPSGEDTFYDITRATQRTEPYPHWKK